MGRGQDRGRRKKRKRDGEREEKTCQRRNIGVRERARENKETMINIGGGRRVERQGSQCHSSALSICRTESKWP